jgi:Tfp pilus assembly protein PilF
VLQALGGTTRPSASSTPRSRSIPNFATTHSNLGNLYFRRDEIARARDAYLAAIRLDPEHADAHNNLGSAYFRLGDRGRAEREYREALRLDPQSRGRSETSRSCSARAPTVRSGATTRRPRR